MSKRIFDIVFSLVILILLSWLVLVSWIIACFDTHSNGIFLQTRIGKLGKPFTIVKLRTMHLLTNKISKLGAVLRRFKLDEIPQFINVLQGTMSIVGPRPDVPGYYDKLTGEAGNILKLKPGLTSIAAIKYTNEEATLAAQKNPVDYYNTVIFPDKVLLNLEYYKQHSLLGDIKIILRTLWAVLK